MTDFLHSGSGRVRFPDGTVKLVINGVHITEWYEEGSQQGEALPPRFGRHMGEIMGEAGGAADGGQEFIPGQHLWKGSEEGVICGCAVIDVRRNRILLVAISAVLIPPSPF